MVKERPSNPIEFLASYLLQHDPQRITDTTVGGSSGGTGMPVQTPPTQVPGASR